MPAKIQGQAKYEALLDTKHLQAGLKKRAIRGAGFTISAQTLNYGIQTIGTIILARLLTPEDFGMVAMVSAFSMLLQNFGGNGFTEAIVQREDLTHHQMSKLFWTNLCIMLGLSLAFMAMSPLLVWFYKEPQLKRISVAMSLSIFFGGLTTCHFALLSRNMKFHLTSMAQVSSGVLSTVLAVITATQGIGYWALVLRRITTPLLTATFVWIFCHWRPSIPTKSADIKPILRFGVRTYGNFLMDYFRKNSDKVIIGKFFGRTPLGHYDRATNLSSLLPNQLTAALSGVGVATLSRLRGDPRKYLDYYAKSLSIQAFFAFPGSVLFTLLGKDIILLLLGGQWTKAGDIFVALGPAIGLVVIYDTNIWLHLSLGRPDRLLRWSISVLFLSVLSFFIGTIFGPIGVAIAYSTLFYVLLLPALYYAGRPLKIKASYFLSILWKYWFSAFSAGAICWTFLHILKPTSLALTGLAPLAKTICGASLYLIIYSCFIIILFKGPKPFSLVFSTIKEIFR